MSDGAHAAGRTDSLKDRVVALLSGVLPAGAFPELNLWWTAPLGLTVVVAIVASAPRPLDAAVRAWLAGTGYFIATGHWMLPNTGPGLPAFATLLALTWVPWGWIAHVVLRPPPSAPRLVGAPLILASAFVAGEYVRSWERLGGPWALVGAGQWENRPVLGLAAIGGVWLIGFFVFAVAAATSLGFAPSARSPLPRLPPNPERLGP